MKASLLVVFFSIAVLSVAEARAKESAVESVDRLFLEGDYARAILEAERLIPLAGATQDKEELHYLKALSLMRQKRYKEARGAFSSMLVGFKQPRRHFDAVLGVGDTYYLEGDYGEAIKHYDELIKGSPSGKNLGIVHYRLGNCYNSSGIYKKAGEHFEKARLLAPLSLEARMIPDVRDLGEGASCGITKGHFSVQVGAFKTEENARNLARRLSKMSYGEDGVEVINPDSKDEALYKVRVGACRSRAEAGKIAERLKLDGYKTKICP